jgi:EAL and modified HD-GYP domain-containing signal transduction protein
VGDIFIGRQPIFDRRLKVIGYELLYRDLRNKNKAIMPDGNQATIDVVMNAVVDIGLDRLVQDKKAFINVTDAHLISKLPMLLSMDRVVIEVLESVSVSYDAITAIKELADKGYEIALDDFTSQSRAEAFINYAKIIKVDMLSEDVFSQETQQFVRELKQYGVRLLAEKVETQQEFEKCLQLGFDYFQGFFLCEPKTLRSNQISTSKMVVLQGLAKIQDPDVSYRDLEQIITQDVNMSYKLLNLVNSAMFGAVKEITSIRQAISLLGISQLKSWLSMILFSQVTDKPTELTVIAMTRAKMCELLARQMNYRHADQFFLVGLFSVLDALLDMPLRRVLRSLSLSEEINLALVSHEGQMGELLEVAIQHERGDWDELRHFDLPLNVILNAYLSALDWVSEITSAIELQVNS